MSSDDDEYPKLYRVIGSLESGVASLNSKVDDVRKDLKEDLDRFGKDLSDVRNSVVELNGKTVKQPQYTSDVQGIQRSIENLRTDLSKKKTRDDHPAVQLNRTGQFDTGEVTPAPPQALVRATTFSQDTKPSFAQRIKDNAVAITAVLGLLGTLGIGVYKFTKMLINVEAVLEAQKKELKTKPKTRIIYVKPKDSSIE